MDRNAFVLKKNMKMVPGVDVENTLQRVEQISRKITSLNGNDDSTYLIALVRELNGHIEKLYISARILHADYISLAKICRLYICDQLGYIPN